MKTKKVINSFVLFPYKKLFCILIHSSNSPFEVHCCKLLKHKLNQKESGADLFPKLCANSKLKTEKTNASLQKGKKKLLN